jgi:hypothetical protein
MGGLVVPIAMLLMRNSQYPFGIGPFGKKWGYFWLFTQYLVVVSGRIPIRFMEILPGKGGRIVILFSPSSQQIHSYLLKDGRVC